jgi:hypothetical protein
VSELPSSEDLDPSTGTDAPTPPTTTGPSSYTLNWEEPDYPASLIQLGAGLLSLQGMPDTGSAYSYLFTAQRRLSR